MFWAKSPYLVHVAAQTLDVLLAVHDALLLAAEYGMRVTMINGTPGGRFTAWYEDDDMFWGHVVTVDGTLKKGPIGADMQG